MQNIIRITSKRQATLPAQLCKDMDIKPGDDLILERHFMNGSLVWVLRSPQVGSCPWYGKLKAYAAGKSHDIESIRQSIAGRHSK